MLFLMMAMNKYKRLKSVKLFQMITHDFSRKSKDKRASKTFFNHMEWFEVKCCISEHTVAAISNS